MSREVRNDVYGGDAVHALSLGMCICYLSKSIWKSARAGEFSVGKPPRKVTLRLNRGEYIELMTFWIVDTVALLALFFVFAMNFSGLTDLRFG